MLERFDRALELRTGRVATGQRRGPSRWTVVASLAVLALLFLWLAVGIAVPWQLAVSLALVVAAILGASVAMGGYAVGRRPWQLGLALGVALVLALLLAAFLTLVLFLVLIQGALAGKGLLPFFLVPGILIFALYMNPGLVLYLTLTLVLILATGVLMDAGPVAFLAVPLVLSLGVVVVLFHELSPGEGRKIRHLR